MTRRIAALLTMILLIGLVLLLAWRVYLHHVYGGVTEEPAIVALRFHTS
jgi:hypothetical protein